MANHELPRRVVLLGALAVVAAGVLPSGARTLMRPGAADDPLLERVRGLVDSPGVRQLGRAQLPDVPAGASASGIIRGIFPDRFPSDGHLEALPDEELLDVLNAVVVTDLGEGRLRSVEGWLLSETEAHLALLTVLQR